jgi:hypothetical protein
LGQEAGSEGEDGRRNNAAPLLVRARGLPCNTAVRNCRCVSRKRAAAVGRCWRKWRLLFQPLTALLNLLACRPCCGTLSAATHTGRRTQALDCCGGCGRG